MHATTIGCVVVDPMAQERSALIAGPGFLYGTVLTVGRRVSCEGMVPVGGNLHEPRPKPGMRKGEAQSTPWSPGSHTLGSSRELSATALRCEAERMRDTKATGRGASA